MIAPLNKELVAALHAVGDGELEVVDPDTQRKYVLVDSDTHHRPMDALRFWQDRDAIAAGLAQLEAGDGQPLDQAFSGLQSRLGLLQSP